VTAHRVNARRRVVLTASIALALPVCGLVMANPAHAVFPGGNGKLALSFEVFDPPDPAPLASPGAANRIYNLRWSADGARLTGQGPGGVRETRIWVVDEDGQNARSVTAPPGGAFDENPAWSRRARRSCSRAPRRVSPVEAPRVPRRAPATHCSSSTSRRARSASCFPPLSAAGCINPIGRPTDVASRR